jgi:hypothetical protein
MGVPPEQRDRVHKEWQKKLEDECVITVAGFLNADGGTLLVGVRDDGSIAGIEIDFKHMKPKRTTQPRLDMWEMYLRNAIKADLGNTASAQVAVSFAERAQGTVAVVRCDRGTAGTWIRQRLLRARRQHNPKAHATRSIQIRAPALAELASVTCGRFARYKLGIRFAGGERRLHR